MAKKMYDIEYGPTWWECTVVIDHTPETDEAIRQMVEFWEGFEKRLDENDGDYTRTFLQSLGRKINYIQIMFTYGLDEVISHFSSIEGWCKMDGTMGIEIISIDDFDFTCDQYVVTEGLPVDDGGEAEAE